VILACGVEQPNVSHHQSTFFTRRPPSVTVAVLFCSLIASGTLQLLLSSASRTCPSSAQIPNQNSSANHQNHRQHSDKLRGLNRQVNTIATRVIEASDSEFASWDVRTDALTLPTPERNNGNDNTPDVVARNLEDGLKDNLEDSLKNTCWHGVRVGLTLGVRDSHRTRALALEINAHKSS